MSHMAQFELSGLDKAYKTYKTYKYEKGLK